MLTYCSSCHEWTNTDIAFTLGGGPVICCVCHTMLGYSDEFEEDYSGRYQSVVLLRKDRNKENEW